jgi:hypothetical protein
MALVVALTGLLACGPKETPEQRLERLRHRHTLLSQVYKSSILPDGTAETMVDISLTNDGKEHLPELTVLIRIIAADGEERHAQRVTLDLTDVRPGTSVQVAAFLPGVEVTEGEEVFAEIEGGLSDEDLRSLPEFESLPQS